ncbi:MAG: PP2C family protein-serine/threonine phosphatase [Alkalilacustris sp.]
MGALDSEAAMHCTPPMAGVAADVEAPAVGVVPRRDVLVVDDSKAQRTVLVRMLSRWGYGVLQAASGSEALELCRRRPVELVLSDWMMPGLSGLEFCREFRALPAGEYGYFILLTSRSDKGAVALGLREGADDFLTKPVNPEELRARLSAGERVLRMQHELRAKHALVTDTLAQLQSAHDALNRDLEQARQLQQSLVREREARFGSTVVSLMLRPSGHVGGDLVGFFPLGRRRIGLYAIDVSGHGVTAALLAARLAGLFSGAVPEQNIALMPAAGDRRGAAGRPPGSPEPWPGAVEGDGPSGAVALRRCRDASAGPLAARASMEPVARPPVEVAAALNRILLEEVATDHYCTLLYAEIDLASGAVRLVQAGHPHPLIQRACGRIEYLGDGGLPLGLIPGATHAGTEAVLGPGDRLLIMSDGITECADPAGSELGEVGLERLVRALADRQGCAFLDGLEEALGRHSGEKDFSDDVSAVLLEFGGSAAPVGAVSGRPSV